MIRYASEGAFSRSCVLDQLGGVDCIYHGNDEQKFLVSIAKAKAEELAKSDNVLAVGVTGSLARGNVRISSDIDMTIVLSQSDKNYSFQRMKIEGRTLEMISITLGLLEEAVGSRYDSFPPEPWDVHPCRILYDPQGILKSISERTSEIWNSPEYYERIVKRKVLRLIQEAEEGLEKATKALENGDYASTVGLTREALKQMARAVIEATRSPLSPSREASMFETMMLKLDRQELAEEVFRILGIEEIDRQEARRRLDNLETLLSLSRNALLDNAKFRNHIAERPSTLDLLDSWVDPMFEGGHYLDVAWCVSLHAGLLRYLFETIVNEWPPKNPKGYYDHYLKCTNLDEIDEESAKNILEKSLFLVAILKELLMSIMKTSEMP